MSLQDFGLTSQEIIEVLHVNIEDIPDEYTRKTAPENIHGIELVSNNIYYAPQRLREFSNLQILKISYNKIEFLTNEVFSLKALSCLVVENCQLTHLPASLAMMRQLRILSAPHNKIEYVAPGLFSIPTLKYVNLDYNCIKRLSLENLIISSKPVVSLFGNPLEMENDDEMLGVKGLVLVLSDFLFWENNEWSGIPISKIYNNISQMITSRQKGTEYDKAIIVGTVAGILSIIGLILVVIIFKKWISSESL